MNTLPWVEKYRPSSLDMINLNKILILNVLPKIN